VDRCHGKRPSRQIEFAPKLPGPSPGSRRSSRKQAILGYRRRGFRVAIDDFGAQDSNFDRLWRLTPDVVKIDRTLVVEAVRNPRARRVLPRIVDIIHQLGATVVCEGIETCLQDALARDSGADLVQGFLYGKPASLAEIARRADEGRWSLPAEQLGSVSE